MSNDVEMKSWRALTVRSRHEKFVAQHLQNRGLEQFLPLHWSKRSWSDRSAVVEMPLFPGYIFCRLSSAQRLLALSTPGVTSIVSFGGEEAPVDDREIANIRQLLASGLAVTPCRYIKPGQVVEIQAGPLTGLRGTVVREKGMWHLVINVELLHRSVAAELAREDIRAIENAPPLTEGLALQV